jgi:hypothetical protein
MQGHLLAPLLPIILKAHWRALSEGDHDAAAEIREAWLHAALHVTELQERE